MFDRIYRIIKIQVIYSGILPLEMKRQRFGPLQRPEKMSCVSFGMLPGTMSEM